MERKGRREGCTKEIEKRGVDGKTRRGEAKATWAKEDTPQVSTSRPSQGRSREQAVTTSLTAITRVAIFPRPSPSLFPTLSLTLLCNMTNTFQVALTALMVPLMFTASRL
jgi:hypothetical protein